MSDAWTARLSEFLDGTLPDAERRTLEAHLAECAECPTVLTELSAVIDQAQRLTDRPPAADLWPGIARRIRGGAEAASPAVRPLQPRGPRGVTLSWLQLAAAAAVLIAVSGGLGVALRPAAPASAVIGSGAAPAPAVLARSATLPGDSEQHYDAAVTDLQSILTAGRGQLDSVTVRVLEENLARIDQAIAESRRALAADPANAFLNAHLARAMRQKLELLRRAASLATVAS